MRGAAHRVPCPYCKRHNDFRPHLPQRANSAWGSTWANNKLQSGSKAKCDHCKRWMKIRSVKTVTILTVEQYNKHVPERG